MELLFKFLNSKQFKLEKNNFNNFIKPQTILINNKEAFLFNHVIDPTENSYIEDSIAITQQPFESDIPLHVHEFIELTYVFRGKSEMIINNQKITLYEGMIAMIDAFTPHSVHASTKEDIILCITLKKDYLSPKFLSRLSSNSVISDFLLNLLVKNRQSNQFLIFNTGRNNNIIEVINHIVWEYFNKRIYSEEIIDSYLIIFFSELIREDEINKQFIHIPDATNHTLIDFLQYIEDNYKDCTLTTMARHFNFHPNYLSNLLKKGTGKSFKDLLQLQKMSKASLMLINSNIPIPDIVDEIGYSSVAFFYKKFKELYGMTPNDYRKEHSLFTS